jgi:hypothetical protein
VGKLPTKKCEYTKTYRQICRNDTVKERAFDPFQTTLHILSTNQTKTPSLCNSNENEESRLEKEEVKAK